MTANAVRGEAAIHVKGREVLLRPTFDALVRAEEELGSLFALVERAGEGQLKLTEIAALFWFCLAHPGPLTREDIGDAVLAMGLAEAAKPLKTLLGQILRGQ
ncbi:gene transfer agent family protein [Qipengyuania sp. 1NDH17]|uniref:Gene transfer agent family protein n=1 Tax=Qipengyuania polymorpha TaxID=2867234 RepID=A0ABS7J2B0_9SPHN|nr:gene transfer agent family protein [Qipengyuania polymorpha]